MTDLLLLGKAGEQSVKLFPSMANRHGLIAGATGTGKTLTLKLLAESFSSIGVPVFITDIKGDISGTAVTGTTNPKVEERAKLLGLSDFAYASNPVAFWDVYGQQGHPVRTTISELGPLLISRLLGLNETQDGVLSLVFKIADDQGLMLLDLKDLTAMLQHVAEHNKELAEEYGLLSKATIGAIQRQVLALETEIGDTFFGEPALNLEDFIQTNAEGKGVINILAADKLMLQPKLYAVFLLWMLSELFETLPEIGDCDKPKFVLFFDEAHLMFSDAPKILLDKIKQVMLLIRSKGVGVYFITQNPMDISEDVLGQLGNRVQHALRVFSPKDQKVVKSISDGFRANPEFDLETIIPELGVGEAVVSVLDEKGLPTIVQRTLIAPPRSFIGPIDSSTRLQIIKQSAVYGAYEEAIDRESAYEKLKNKAEMPVTASAKQQAQEAPQRRSSRSSDPLDAFIKSTVRAIGSQVGRQLVRGIMGALIK